MFCAFYCVITSNIPFVIQRDVLVCQQSNSTVEKLACKPT